MNKLQILVVEDDTPVRNLITTTLKAHDYRFFVAVNGKEAVMSTASINPDVILLDLGLPDIDGVEVIRRINAYAAGQLRQTSSSVPEAKIMIKSMH